MKITVARSLLLAASAAAFASSGLPPAFGEEQSAGSIHIEYAPPKNPQHQELYALLQQRRALEQLQKIFSAFRLPRDVMITTVGCDGVSNAWYQEKNGVPTVTLCYEYLHDIWQSMPKDTTEEGVTPADALVGQLLFASAHEFGHLSFDVYDVPLFGREEDAADNFATYVILQFHEEAHDLIAGAAYSYRLFVKNAKANPEVALPLAAFSSNHGEPEQRYFNLLCIAYGSDDKLFADLVEKGHLPKTRAKYCRYEFEVLRYGFRTNILPHIDQDVARKVSRTDWLDIFVPRPTR